MIKVKKYTLNNGLRLITIPKADSLSTTVMIMVKAGSLDEGKKISGLSHFIEHMCFKGTERWPNQLALATEFEKIAAERNAFTSQEFTGYYVTVVPRHLDRALELLSDMYLRPVFDTAEIERERGVIKEEIKRNHDLPSRRVYDLYQELCYGDSPAGRNIAGTARSVSDIIQADFISYRNKYYTAPNTVVVVAGKFNQLTIKEDIKKYFTSLSNQSAPRRPKTKIKAKIDIGLEKRETNQSWLVFGWPGVDRFHPDYYVAGVLAKILGGSMISRLWQKIREEMGAAYSVGAYHDSLSDSGQFVISAGTSPEKAGVVVRAALEECRRVISGGVTEAELALAKDSLIGGLEMGLETSSDLANFYGFSELLRDKMLSPKDIKHKIEAIKVTDIRRLARSIFNSDKFKLAVLGPHRSQAEFVKALKK